MRRDRLCAIAFFVLLNVGLLKSEGFTIQNPIRFPYGIGGTYIGIFLAIAVPLDLPRYNIFISYNIEANYNLPQNETEYSYPPIISKRSFDRGYLYGILENKIEAHGYPGKNCLLRTICETASNGFVTPGVMEDVFHIVFSPSKSKEENDLTEYSKAEQYGRTKQHCKKYRKTCSISLLDLISYKVSHQ